MDIRNYAIWHYDEGDDIIIFTCINPEIAEQMAQLYSACGFSTKLEHKGTVEGSMFVKMVIV